HIPYSSELSMIGVTLVLSYFTLVFGELVPKRIALKKAETIALFSVSAIYSISIVARPFIKILSLSTSLILKLTGNTSEDIEEKVSEEELRALIYQSKKDGCIEAEEQQMLEGVFEFNDRMAKEIMTHRKDTFVINIEEPIEEILDKVIKLHYSRIPVYKDDIDHIVGVLYVKDLIAEARKVGFESIALEKILHTPYFVPETKKINALFKSFKEKKKHIAILINEYGGFAGIVTMEDLIEEIMGEIHDEYDEEEEGIKKIGKNTFLVKGSEAIYHINHSLGIQLPNGDYDTLNGYLAQQIGDIPEENVDIEMDHIHFKIIKMKSNRIEQVQIQFIDSL
ncbi:MAG: hemolysin family protein, partial [Candidatus Niameybacter stercoravium]|nr:hemolysin family protein [Candidatus Niameybacter stercoravium]